MAVCRGAKRKQSAEEAPAKPKYACRPIIQLQPPSDAQEEPVRLELTERSSPSTSPSTPTADQPDCANSTSTKPMNEPRNELDADVPLVCAAGDGDGEGAAGDCECANNRADELRTCDEVRVSVRVRRACRHLRL